MGPGLTDCDECGWRGSIAFKAPCPRCGAEGGGLTEDASRLLEEAGMSPLERINRIPIERRITRIQERLEGVVVRVIPAKNARTAKATAASLAKRQAPTDIVVKLTNDGLSAAQIAVRLGIKPRWVGKLRARAKVQAIERSIAEDRET